MVIDLKFFMNILRLINIKVFVIKLGKCALILNQTKFIIGRNFSKEYLM